MNEQKIILNSIYIINKVYHLTILYYNFALLLIKLIKNI